MTVHFVGAGPGAPDLVTVRGAELVARCPVVLYAGSLVPRAVVARAAPDARVLDSSGMTLDEIVEEMAAADRARKDVARVHTGDPCLFGAIAEQMRRLDALGIPYDVVPGVSSFTAAAAALRCELTVPGVSQAVVLARAPGRTPVPAGQRPEDLARGGATLALFLSAGLLDEAARDLAATYGPDCPAAVVERASWPDERAVRGTLATIAAQARAAGIDATAMVLVGPALAARGFPDSRLYAPGFGHRFRPARRAERGLLVVYTGDGKGKTTAALGMAFRALGRGLPVAVVQFIKGRWKTGERLLAATLPGLTFLTMGEGFTRGWDDPEAHARAARAAWAKASQLVRVGEHGIVVLDELTHAIRHGFVPLGDVLAALTGRPRGVTVVVTGRDAPPELALAADLVTEMRCVKHPFEHGVRALPGIDY